MDNETAAMDIIGAFDIPGRCIGIKANKQGHINSTFISTFRDGDVERKYTHQRINSTVFPHPEEVMENILRVTEHLAGKTAGMPDAGRRTLRVIPARDGKPYAVDSEGMYWRTYSFIDGVVAYGRVPDEGIAYSLGKGIGTFQSLLSDFDGSSLHAVIPHFHDMGMRYRQLRAALASDPMNRKEGIKEELDFLLANERRGCVIWDSWEEGLLPTRVTHNDTKISNVLFSETTGEALAVIDLDTIMPGTVLFDTGDMIRTACSTADEDEKDAFLMDFSIPCCKALTEGYMEAASFLGKEERGMIKESGRTITQIMAVRFLTDYLNGDVYYRTDYSTHNLVRARTQIALMKAMDRKWDQF